MARGTKDVELVVRARNEASKSLNAIKTALDGLKSSQEQVATSSDKTGSTLSRLDGELKKLASTIKSDTGVDKLSSAMDKATAAVARLEDGLTKATSEATKLEGDLANAAAAVSKFAAESESLKASLIQQKVAVAAAQAEYKKLAAELKAGESAIAGSQAQSQKYIDSLGKQEAALSKTQQKHRELASAILASENPSSKLLDNFEKIDAKLRSQSTTLAKTRSDYSDFQQKIRELSTTVPALAVATDQADAAFKAASASEKQTASALAEVSKEGRSATAELTRLQTAVAANAASITKQQGALAQAKTDLKELASATEQARQKSAELDQATFRKVADDAANLNKAAEYVRWWTQALDAADKAEGKLANNGAMVGSRAGGYNQAAQGARNLASASRDAADGMSASEEKGRAAMTWTQRLRGELIALALAYTGVYGAISQMRAAMQTVIDMDAAQTRLGVAFQGNQEAVARQMSFVQAAADRLGISVKTLATEYSKLSIATAGTSLAGKQTQDIFIALSESFRVMNLSSEKSALAFNAITQMVNKGTVSMEELRQQLGEQVPGAFEIAAKSMNMTTAEFAKLVGEGKIATQDFLPKFAAQLQETFGPQLPDALKKLATDVGKFENAVVKAQMKFANGGFTEGLQKGIQSLTATLESSSGQQALEKLGAAAGQLVIVLADIPKYFPWIASAAAMYLGNKLVGVVSAAVTNFTQFRARMAEAGVAAKEASLGIGQAGKMLDVSALAAKRAELSTRLYMASVGLSTGATTASTVAMRAQLVALKALNGALNLARGLWAAMGGLPGIIVTGISAAIGIWLSRTNEVVDATGEHQRQMNELLQAYDKATDKAGNWADKVKGVSLAGAIGNFNDLRKQLPDLAKNAAYDLIGKTGGFKTADYKQFGEMGELVAKLTMEMVNGQRTIASYRKDLDKVVANPKTPERLKNAIAASDASRKAAAEAEAALIEQITVVEAKGGKLDNIPQRFRDAAKSMEEMSKGTEVVTEDLGTLFDKSEKEFASKIDLMKAKIPEFVDEMKLMEEIKSIDEQLQTKAAIDGLKETSDKYKELVVLAQQAKSVAVEKFATSNSVVDRIVGVESKGVADAKNPLSTATGVGQFIEKTWVNLFKKYFPTEAAGKTEQQIKDLRTNTELSRQMVALYAKENADILQKAGVSVDRAAVYLAHFLGPKGALSVLQAGGNTPVSQLLGKDQINANKNVLEGKTAAEVVAWAQKKMGISEAELGIKKQLAELDRKAVEDEKKKMEDAKTYSDNLNEQLALRREQAQAALDAQDPKNPGQELPSKAKFIELEIEKEILKARKAQKELLPYQLDEIGKIAALEYERLKNDKEAQKLKKEQADQENEINRLQQYRRDLLQQAQLAQDKGDVEGYQKVAEVLGLVDSQLDKAIVKMIEWWKTSGDPALRDAAVAALEAARGSMQRLQDQSKVTAEDISKVFTNQAVAGVDNFLTKISETGNVFGSLKESFLDFSRSFLLQIAKMIAQAALFNAIKAAGNAVGGSVGNILTSIVAAVKHIGGIAGESGATRAVSPAWFNNAVRYHSGGIAGLKPNEVPAVLQKGEEVLTANDPRHINNGGGAAAPNVKIINTIDSGSMVSEGLSTADGERALFNFVRANKASFKQILA